MRHCCGLLLAAMLAAQACAQSAAQVPGESIYRDGVLPSGLPLTAKREPGLTISGADAACSNCHRRSGLGEFEGHIRIPPVTGSYLFSPRAHERDELRLPTVDEPSAGRVPYTEESLARAIRDGVAVDGRTLNYLMPHYTLGEPDMAALIEYLKVMTPAKPPGVDASTLHFATIVTPDADPVKRGGMLEVLEHYFADKSAAALAGSPLLRSSQGTTIKADRRWRLHVWELTGPPTAWEQQLRARLAHEPVLAVISGLSGATWAPIHRFCQQVRLPCLFPNVDLPVAAEQDFYPVYFSKGVLLEAGLIAHQVTDDQTHPAPRRIVQIFRRGDIGQAAAEALRAALPGMKIIDRPLDLAGAGPSPASSLRDLAPADVLVLWLRQDDLALLSDVPPVDSRVFMSGLMGGLGRAPLPASWRGVTTMAYPFDLPDKRRIRVDYPLGWFSVSHIRVVDERVQTDTWLACSLLSETLNHMGGAFIRDYLLEHLEGMLDHQIVTGYYPRLGLAPGQRFASKGGYLVHFTDAEGPRVRATTEWMVP